MNNKYSEIYFYNVEYPNATLNLFFKTVFFFSFSHNIICNVNLELDFFSFQRFVIKNIIINKINNILFLPQKSSSAHFNKL